MTAPLGNYGVYVSSTRGETAGERRNVQRRLRFWLKKTAQQFTPNLNFRRCGRIRRREGPVHLDLDERGHAHFVGLCQCNNVWECPTCELRISYLKRRQLELVAMRHAARGGSLYLNTLAPRHHGGHSLALVRTAVAGAYSFVLGGDRWAKTCDRYGIIGHLRDREITVSRIDGWHVHDHQALFTLGRLTVPQLRNLEDEIFEPWARKLVKIGLPEPSRERGIDIRYLSTSNRNYLVKLGLESELTLSSMKATRGGDGDVHYSMLNVLEIIARGMQTPEGVDSWYVDRWREFVDVMPTTRKHRWSRGIRELYDVPKNLKKLPAEPEPERAPGEEPGQSVRLLTFDSGEWDDLIARNVALQLALLDSAENGATSDQLRALVHLALERDRAA